MTSYLQKNKQRPVRVKEKLQVPNLSSHLQSLKKKKKDRKQKTKPKISKRKDIIKTQAKPSETKNRKNTEKSMKQRAVF